MISSKDHAEIMSSKEEKCKTIFSGTKLIYWRVRLADEWNHEWMDYSTSLVPLTWWVSCKDALFDPNCRKVGRQREQSPALLQPFAPSPAASSLWLLCTGHWSSAWKVYRQDWARRRNPGGLIPNNTWNETVTGPWFVHFLPSLVLSFSTCVSLCFLFKQRLLEMLNLCPLESCRDAVNRQLPKSCVRDGRALLQLPCFCVTNRQYAVLEFF